MRGDQVNDEQKRMAIGAFGNAELNLVNDRPWVAAVHPPEFPAPAASQLIALPDRTQGQR